MMEKAIEILIIMENYRGFMMVYRWCISWLDHLGSSHRNPEPLRCIMKLLKHRNSWDEKLMRDLLAQDSATTHSIKQP